MKGRWITRRIIKLPRRRRPPQLRGSEVCMTQGVASAALLTLIPSCAYTFSLSLSSQYYIHSKSREPRRSKHNLILFISSFGAARKVKKFNEQFSRPLFTKAAAAAPPAKKWNTCSPAAGVFKLYLEERKRDGHRCWHRTFCCYDFWVEEEKKGVLHIFNRALLLCGWIVYSKGCTPIVKIFQERKVARAAKGSCTLSGQCRGCWTCTVCRAHMSFSSKEEKLLE